MDELKDFTDLIKSLHENTSEELKDNTKEDKNIIEIDDKRQLIPGEDFDTTIAYEGDINSQIITFKCVKIHDNHDLSKCSYEELKWKNMTSGNEGVSPLIITDTPTEDTFYLQWEVPAEACTQAGTIEISISIYDKIDNQVIFSWNTAKFTSLTIGNSMESVGFEFPPKDEILVIDRDTKSIIAPMGYNNTICNYGEVGVAEVYFLVNRYLGKKREIDLMNENTSIHIYHTFNGNKYVDDNESRIERKLYTAEIKDRNSEGLVFIKWYVPEYVTAGLVKPDSLQVTLSFKNETQSWYSNIYSHLKIGDNIFFDSEIPEGQEELFDTRVKEVIDNYLSENEFIINGN